MASSTWTAGREARIADNVISRKINWAPVSLFPWQSHPQHSPDLQVLCALVPFYDSVPSTVSELGDYFHGTPEIALGSHLLECYQDSMDSETERLALKYWDYDLWAKRKVMTVQLTQRIIPK